MLNASKGMIIKMTIIICHVEPVETHLNMAFDNLTYEKPLNLIYPSITVLRSLRN